MSGEYIISKSFGASKFWLMIFSRPLPILTIKNVDGTIPISVDQKKLEILTSKRQGNTFAIAKGIPPTNLYTRRKINSDFLNFISRFLNLFKNFSLMISFKK